VLGFVAAGVSGVGNLLYSFVIASVISILYSFLGLVIPLGVAIAISYFLMLLILVAKPEGLKRGLR
jgi:branched-subunit amino acid ABC-type transport system permease component